MSPPHIVLVGSTGYTGSLVARELAGGDVPFVLAGRDGGKLERLAASLSAAGAGHAGSQTGAQAPGAAGEKSGSAGPPRAGATPPSTATVDVTRPETLKSLLRPGDVVVSCAGPFLELGEPVIRACIEAGAHYLDTTGEQRFMKRVVDRYDEAAREAGVTVANAMAFEYALGDAAAALAADGLGRPLRLVELVYGWTGGAAATSRGTRASILRIMAAPGLAYRDGAWVPERAARRRTVVELPDGSRRPAITLPTGEIVTVPRHLDVRGVRGWAVTGGLTARAATLLSPVLPALVRSLLPLLDRWARGGAAGPSEAERRSGEFEIVARATGAGGRTRTVAVRGQDPYGLTAAIITAGARRLAGGGLPDGGLPGGEGRSDGETDVPAGVQPPVRLLPPADLRRVLEGRGLRWDTL
jgi:short subunit dehydrogenase-like uncharacterized protein